MHLIHKKLSFPGMGLIGMVKAGVLRMKILMLLVICVIGLSGCNTFAPNTRQFIKDNLTAWGNPRTKPTVYNHICIGYPLETFYSRNHTFTFKVADKIFRSDDDIDYTSAEKMGDLLPFAWSEGGKIINISKCQYWFVFDENGVLCSLIANYNKDNKEQPIFGNKDGSIMYTMPLTEEQMIEIFGQPDKIVEYSTK